MEKRRVVFTVEIESEQSLRRLEREVKKVVLLDARGKVVEGCKLDEWPDVRTAAAPQKKPAARSAASALAKLSARKEVVRAVKGKAKKGSSKKGGRGC